MVTNNVSSGKGCLQVNDPYLTISHGGNPLVSTVKWTNKFGRATNVDTHTTDIWDGSNAVTDQDIWVAPTQARIHSIVSTSDEDSDIGGTEAQGDGARTIQVYGLKTWSSLETSELIVLDGTTAVNTSESYVIIHRMKVITCGANDINTGYISATAATDGTLTAQINPNEGQTQMAIYGIPSGEIAYMTCYYESAIKASTSLAIEATLMVNTNPDVQLTNFLVKHTLGLATEGTNSDEHCFKPYFKITGPALIKMQGLSSSNNTDVSAGFDLIRVVE